MCVCKSVCVYVSMCVFVRACICVNAQRGQTRILEALEMELHAVVNFLACVWRGEPNSGCLQVLATLVAVSLDPATVY